MNDPRSCQPGDLLHGMPTFAATPNPTPSGISNSVPSRPTGQAGTRDTPRAWAHDPMVHPWDYWWGHFYRWKRRPRCDGGED